MVLWGSGVALQGWTRMANKAQRCSKVTRREFMVTAAGVATGLAGLAITRGARAAAPAVSQGNQDVVVGIGTDVVTLDTRVMMSVPAESQILHVEEPLVFASNDGKQLNILAGSWEPSTAPPGWRVRLRPGIKFDNGEPFTAQSVKVTVESITAEENRSWVAGEPRTLLASIKEVKVEDDWTVFLRTEPFFRALPINTYVRAMLPPKLAAAKGKEFGVTPSGTGHYRFVEYRSKSHLHLEAKPDYHGFWDGPAKNGSLTFRFLPENATRVAALEAGEVHLIDNLPPDVASRIRGNPNLGVVTSSTNRIMGLYFHGGRPPFNNLKARLAVTYAIDREAIVSKIMGGMTEVVNQPFPPRHAGGRRREVRSIPV
jgi:peptide/nickel transport system substrate-binding protein